MYRNDDLLVYLFEETYKSRRLTSKRPEDDLVGFWRDINDNYPDYKKLSKLAILLMTLTPDTCEC